MQAKGKYKYLTGVQPGLSLTRIYPWRLSEKRNAGSYVSSVRVDHDEPPSSRHQIADLLTYKINAADVVYGKEIANLVVPSFRPDEVEGGRIREAGVVHIVVECAATRDLRCVGVKPTQRKQACHRQRHKLMSVDGSRARTRCQDVEPGKNSIGRKTISILNIMPRRLLLCLRAHHR